MVVELVQIARDQSDSSLVPTHDLRRASVVTPPPGPRNELRWPGHGGSKTPGVLHPFLSLPSSPDCQPLARGPLGEFLSESSLPDRTGIVEVGGFRSFRIEPNPPARDQGIVRREDSVAVDGRNELVGFRGDLKFVPLTRGIAAFTFGQDRLVAPESPDQLLPGGARLPGLTLPPEEIVVVRPPIESQNPNRSGAHWLACDPEAVAVPEPVAGQSDSRCRSRFADIEKRVRAQRGVPQCLHAPITGDRVPFPLFRCRLHEVVGKEDLPHRLDLHRLE